MPPPTCRCGGSREAHLIKTALIGNNRAKIRVSRMTVFCRWEWGFICNLLMQWCIFLFSIFFLIAMKKRVVHSSCVDTAILFPSRKMTQYLRRLPGNRSILETPFLLTLEGLHSAAGNRQSKPRDIIYPQASWDVMRRRARGRGRG